MTEKRQTSQGYIIRILQHFATKLRNITNFVMLFQAMVIIFVQTCLDQNFTQIGIGEGLLRVWFILERNDLLDEHGKRNDSSSDNLTQIHLLAIARQNKLSCQWSCLHTSSSWIIFNQSWINAYKLMIKWTIIISMPKFVQTDHLK
jgi:hypothetical protein